MTRRTPDNQAKDFAQGLALGVLSAGTDWISADKLRFEFGLSHAWRETPNLHRRFPSLLGPSRPDPIYMLRRSESRRGPIVAAWAPVDRGWQPYLTNEGWGIDESGQMFCGWTETRWSDWQHLGSELVAYYDSPPGA
ncbi:hypothetical protein [Janibacter massiliensis]|uniref:hypothetical protein n=1 Tax=Janibacter massiliensis TaxID=2058291 RepID=UPI000D10A0B2|nr:hypothetical protein [Janibacter massiliensis]